MPNYQPLHSYEHFNVPRNYMIFLWRTHVCYYGSACWKT